MNIGSKVAERPIRLQHQKQMKKRCCTKGITPSMGNCQSKYFKADKPFSFVYWKNNPHIITIHKMQIDLFPAFISVLLFLNSFWLKQDDLHDKQVFLVKPIRFITVIRVFFPLSWFHVLIVDTLVKNAWFTPEIPVHNRIDSLESCKLICVGGNI